MTGRSVGRDIVPNQRSQATSPRVLQNPVIAQPGPPRPPPGLSRGWIRHALRQASLPARLRLSRRSVGRFQGTR